MKTYRELEVGDKLYVLTTDMVIIKTVISAIRRKVDYVRFELVEEEMPDMRLLRYIDNHCYFKGTWSWSTATNLRDIKRVKAVRTADGNRRIRHEDIRKS